MAGAPSTRSSSARPISAATSATMVEMMNDVVDGVPGHRAPGQGLQCWRQDRYHPRLNPHRLRPRLDHRLLRRLRAGRRPRVHHAREDRPAPGRPARWRRSRAGIRQAGASDPRLPQHRAEQLSSSPRRRYPVSRQVISFNPLPKSSNTVPLSRGRERARVRVRRASVRHARNAPATSGQRCATLGVMYPSSRSA